MMASIADNQTQGRKKMHPQKFAMWIAIGSISMMFAGLTSGFIVRHAQGNWRSYELPSLFYVSTAIILLSSITLIVALRKFKGRYKLQFRRWLLITLVLGIAFCVLQILGFQQLYQLPQVENLDGTLGEAKSVTLQGNPSESFLFIITGLHILHIVGGVVALAILYLRSFRKNVKVYSSAGLEIAAIYWHFIDVLWIYLFIFFLVNL